MDELNQQWAVTLEEKHEPITLIGGQRGGGKIFFLENMVKFLKEQLKQEKTETERWKSAALYYADKLGSVQEWISVKDRLPTIYDADADNCVLAIHKVSDKRYYHWRSVADNPFDFTHWMKTPQPPKGE